MILLKIKKNPLIKATNAWNPFILGDKVAVNDFLLSKESGQNFLISGAHKSGNFTFMTQVSLNLLLAHTLGIAAADSFSCTPFTLLLGYMDTVDSITAKKLISKMHSLKDSQFGFVFLDELCTHPEANKVTCSSYELITTLNDISSCCFIATSQCHKLQEFEHFSKGNCITMHMARLPHESDALNCSYILKRSVSRIQNKNASKA